jgi:hypothetical protein
MFFLSPWVLAPIGFLIGTNVHGHTDWFDKIGSRSPAFDNDQVSADINHALTKFGFDADEAKSLRAGYHVAVDQFDDNEDESRKLLSDVLLKVLNAPDVDTIDGSLDTLGDKFDGLIPRDADTTTGSKDGVKPGHVIVTESAESVNNLAPRDDKIHVTFAEAMATFPEAAEAMSMTSNDRANLYAVEQIHSDKVDGIHEKREEGTDHAGPELVEPVKEPVQNEPPVEHPTPIESPTLIPFLEKFKAMGLLNNSTKHRAATPEDARRIFSAIQNAQSLTDSERAKLKFLAKLNAMGLLKKPKGKRVLTVEEVFERIQSMRRKVKPELDTTPTPTAEGPTIPDKYIPVPEAQGSHSKRSVPKVPGCDCEATMGAVKDPKPEGGMTYKWFQTWKHKAVNTSCVHPCVDNAIDRLTKTVFEYQAFEERMNKEYPGCLDCQLNQTSVEKREEPTVSPEFAKAKLVMPSQELPKTADPLTYRDWYSKTQKNGDLCTYNLRQPSIWTWVMAFTGKSQRCRNFCSQSVKPFLEKEKETSAEPATPDNTTAKPADGSAPSDNSSTEGPTDDVPPRNGSPVDLEPISEERKDDTQPELVKTEPEALGDESWNAYFNRLSQMKK